MAVGAAVLVLVILAIGIYALMIKKKTEKAVKNSRPFGSWGLARGEISGGAPKLKGARWFSFEELRLATNNFSTQNVIGSRGYGKVYKGMLAVDRQMVAMKRATAESMQGGAKFKTEIELLSQVHHMNLVGLIGFCFEEGEHMLVYDYMPNGSLRDSLSVSMDFLKQSYNPFCVIGQGYLDPEYYMTQQLSYKSDVYSYGVVLLEILSGKEPIERGKYLVREVRTAIERGGINALAQRRLLDTILAESPMTPSILGSFVRLALHCCEDYGTNRPKMSEVMKELEAIAEDMGDNERDEETTKFGGGVLAIHPYAGSASFDYSGSGGNI
ncbi:hypothetical protein KI387_025647, partial [Taxus chinensis]